MMRLGFVTPWYGDKIPGGAEMELRGIAKHLKASGIDVEIICTCIDKFTSDWNKDFHKPGLTEEGGLPVRRFKVRKRDTKGFDAINLKLMQNEKVTAEEEKYFISEMVNSTDLCDYLKDHKDEYDLFVFIPYMFGTTYHGIKAVPEKSVLIPCLHDESYAYMDIYKEVFKDLAGMIYHANNEYELANRIYDLSKVDQAVLGEGVDTEFTYDAERFRREQKIEDPFILYAGRKDAGKNIYLLIDYFREYRKRHEDSKLKLVLIGGGEVKIPNDIRNEVIDLGFVDPQVKYDACAAALTLCQPSIHESFSLVLMESWLCERPALVHADCDVTRGFAQQSNSALYFKDYYEFEGCIDFYTKNEETAEKMGKTGRQFVLDNFTWDVIVRKYTEYFERVIKESKEK
ncbi:MAG: glycosyltransferase family 4 protein [Clostridiales bacterium]|nr:glycosyltransferase family 4 protein [Clostridiales bacterium]